MKNTDFTKSNFIEDIEKMIDFYKLSKEEFLQSYSYLTEEEYDNTKKLVLCKDIGEVFGKFYEENGLYCIDNREEVFRYASTDELLVDWLDTLIQNHHDEQHYDENGISWDSWNDEITYIYSEILGRWSEGIAPVEDEKGNINWECRIDDKVLPLGKHPFIVDAMYARRDYLKELGIHKQTLGATEIYSLNLNCDEYFDSYDYFCSISHDPFVFSAKFPNNFDSDVNKKFAEFFREKLKVKSCDYGCDTYPFGIHKPIEGSGVYTFQQNVWDFINRIEQAFNCKCNFMDGYNGFEFVFEFGTGDNKGCYCFGAGNNGQEFTQSLYLKDWKQIHDLEFCRDLMNIDRIFYRCLEYFDLKRNPEQEKASLDDKLQSAKERVGFSKQDNKEKPQITDEISK